MSGEADEIPAQVQQRIGKTLCRKYTLEKVIGLGGMAAVYRGVHRNGNKVAVKVLHTELSVYKDVRERFLREGYVANKVDHPAIVRVLDDDVAEDGAVFIVMELLEGESLEEHIVKKGGSLSANEAVPFVCQLLDVLVAAHAQGIVHRDLKPENLFVMQRDGSLKVLDFGIARLNEGSHQKTRTGRVLGTPAFMAPEQARGETKLVGPRTDIWAVGAILFRALTGRFVHEAPTPEMCMIYAATKPAPSLCSVAPWTAAPLGEIVDRALAENVDDRWPTAAAMANALRALHPEEISSERASSTSAATGEETATTQPVGDRKGSTEPIRHLSTLSFDDETEVHDPAPVPIPSARASGPMPMPVPMPRPMPARSSTTIGVTSARGADGDGRTRPALVVAMVAGAVFAVVAGAVAVVSGMGMLSRATTSTTAANAPPIASSSPSAVAEPRPESTAAAPSAATSATAEPVASATSPMSLPQARPAPPRAHVAADAGRSSAASPAVDCSTPYTLTDAGTKKYKPECL
jgi:serine/threonine-protein kinase